MLFSFLCGLVTGIGLLAAIALQFLDQLDPEAILFVSKALRIPSHILPRFLQFMRNPFSLANRALFHALIRLDYTAGSEYIRRSLDDGVASQAQESLSASNASSSAAGLSSTTVSNASNVASASTGGGAGHASPYGRSAHASGAYSATASSLQLQPGQSGPLYTAGGPEARYSIASQQSFAQILVGKDGLEDVSCILKGQVAFWLKENGDASILSRWCVVKNSADRERNHYNLVVYAKEEDLVPLLHIQLCRSKIQSGATLTHHKWAIEITEYFPEESGFSMEEYTTKSCTYYIMPKEEKYREWFYVLNRYSSLEEYRILMKKYKPSFSDPLRVEERHAPLQMIRQPCFKSGWMEIRENGFIKVWKWRWLVLEESLLQIFSSEEVTDKLSVFNISDAKIYPSQVSKSRNFGIEIRRPDNQQPLLLNAYTDQERNDWVKVLDKASKLSDSMTEKSEAILYSGWLAIQLGAKTKYWKWYYFTFCGSYFKYYKSLDKTVCVGVIELHRWVVQDAKQKTNKDKTFEIINYNSSESQLIEHELHTFQVYDASHYRDWMKILQDNSATNIYEYSETTLGQDTSRRRDSVSMPESAGDLLSTMSTLQATTDRTKDPRATDCYGFNVIFDRLFVDITHHSASQRALGNAILRKFERIKKPNFIGGLTVDNIDFGTRAPIIANFRLLRESSEGELETEFDLTYGGGFSITITCEALVNWPVENPITIPVHLTATIVKLNGKMSMKIPAIGKHELRFSFFQEPDSDFAVTSVLASSIMTFDISRLGEWLKGKLKKILNKAMVKPNSVPLPLPRTELTYMMNTIFRSHATTDATGNPNANINANMQEPDSEDEEEEPKTPKPNRT